MKISELKERFEYTPDKFDNWRIMDEPTGPLKGDCDDWSNTLAWILAGCSMLWYWIDIFTGKTQIWLCKTERGVGHMMIYRRGMGWADNIYPEWSSTVRHRRLFWYWGPFAVLKMAISKVVRIVGAG